MLGIDSLLTKILKQRLFPITLQLVTISFYVPMLFFLLFGPAGKDNLANLIVWMVWWPMLCVFFMFAGRVWCGFFCPFALLSSWAQRAAGLRLAVPDFLRQYSGWLMLIAYFLLLWMEEINFVTDSPRKTAMVLLTMLSGAMIFGLLFRGNAWCRNLCPLGAISHIYARTSLFKIRNNESACSECTTKDCAVPDAHYTGCPMQMTPFAMESVSHCRFCGTCVKRCTNNSLHVAFEVPSKDLAWQSGGTSAIAWFIVLLAGLISFLNAMKSGYLPFETWMQSSNYPVLLKTVLMTCALTVSSLLFAFFTRLTAKNTNTNAQTQIVFIGTLPMIPLLLFSHFGYLSTNILTGGDRLLDQLLSIIGTSWLKIDGLSMAPWNQYFSSLCVFVGLLLSLALLRWSISLSSLKPARSFLLYFGTFYVIFAAWNLVATWPGATVSNRLATEITQSAILAFDFQNGWTILWPYLGINVAVLSLVLIVRYTATGPGDAEESPDFSASHAWAIRDEARGKQTEIFDWLVEQAVEAKWRIPAIISLGNATQEIITFLQRKLPSGSAIKVNAILRKNKAVMTVSHEGQPLSLPDYKAPLSLDVEDDTTLDGIELRLAVAQVEHMSYQARLSEKRCSFTLRQTG